MNETQKSVEDFRNLAKGFRAVIALSDRLDVIGNLEQAESELTASLAQLRRDHEKQMAENAEIKERQKEEWRLIAERIQAENKRLESGAREAANSIVSKATIDASAIEVRAAEIIADAEAAVITLEAKRAELFISVAGLKAEAEDIEGRVTKARAQAAKLLEG